MNEQNVTVEIATSVIEVPCDICGADFDPETVNDVSSSTLCPCCTGTNVLTHGVDILLSRRRR